ARESQVATVSPFSNDAAVCGYPKASSANALPDGMSSRALDALFARENAGVSVEIPCAAPFCMYVTRAALREGSPASPGFSALATSAGLRHVLAADVFVGHVARTPFAPPAGLEPEWQDFLKREPTRPLRRQVDLARLRASRRPRLLLVTHGWGGGVERH